MARPSRDDLEAFLRRQSAADLVALLLELAKDHEAVQARLVRMQLADRPNKLAAGFRQTLSGWRRSTKFYGYREASEFGRMLEGWLDQVERELLPKDPPAALSLFEAFIEADAAWFERADECPRGETVVYRALLKGIRDRAQARTCGHAARCWSRLREIAHSGGGLLPLPSHEDFETEIRARSARKVTFWAYVHGPRRDRHADEDELNP